MFSHGLLFAIPEAITSVPRAYIDPNTGGMLFQMLAVILALFSGVIFFFSRQIKMFFARLRRSIRKDSSEDDTHLNGHQD